MAKFPVEAKVKVATVWSGLSSAVILAVLGVVSEQNLVASLPDWLAVPVAAAITAVITGGTAYQAKHTPR